MIKNTGLGYFKYAIKKIRAGVEVDILQIYYWSWFMQNFAI